MGNIPGVKERRISQIFPTGSQPLDSMAMFQREIMTDVGEIWQQPIVGEAQNETVALGFQKMVL